MNRRIDTFLFGQQAFTEGEDHRALQFRFLCVILLAGALATALIVLGGSTEVNPIDARHMRSMRLFTALSLLLWWLLRGHKARYHAVAWSYLLLCPLEYTSALLFVAADEMRVLWFVTNIPGVYLLLGRRVGGLVTGATMLGLVLVNPRLSAPYSANALATLLVGMAYLAAFFHFYANLSISYLARIRALNERLLHLAMHDVLTGLLNARAYYESCDRALLAARRAGRPCAVLFIDLDHFKAVNDTHGHAAGDEVLRRVAAQVRAQVRRSDLAGRIGGEEFSVFLPDTHEAQALMLAEKLRASIEALSIEVGDLRLHVTASLGVAASSRADGSMAQLQQQADTAMYRAKAQGRNRVSNLKAGG